MDIKESTLFQNSSRHPWETARLQVAFDKIKGIDFGKKHINILDVGSGDLFVISNLSKKFNSTCFAVDTALTQELISEYKNQNQSNDLNVFNSWDKLDASFKGTVDLVLLMDVIEHIEDAVAFLKYIHSKPYINSNTYFFITVPSYQNLFTTHDVILGHFRRYNIALLRNHIESAGMITMETGYFFFTLSVARLIQKFSETIKSPSESDNKTDTAAWNKGGLITSMIITILIADYRISKLFKIAGINLPGLSTYTICRRPA